MHYEPNHHERLARRSSSPGVSPRRTKLAGHRNVYYRQNGRQRVYEIGYRDSTGEPQDAARSAGWMGRRADG